MRFLGSPYPIVSHPRGLLNVQSGINQIKSDLLQLLLTNPGERIFLPLFGTPLNSLIFEQNDTVLESQARDMIISSIQMWEPRITVQQIDVTSNFSGADLNPNDAGVDTELILGIKILFFDPENIKEVQELKLEIPLASSGTTVNTTIGRTVA